AAALNSASCATPPCCCCATPGARRDGVRRCADVEKQKAKSRRQRAEGRRRHVETDAHARSARKGKSVCARSSLTSARRLMLTADCLLPTASWSRRCGTRC